MQAQRRIIAAHRREAEAISRVVRLCALGCLSVLVAPAPAAARPVTVDDLMRVRALTDAAVSPDGSLAAYVVAAASSGRDAYEAEIYLTRIDEGSPVRVGSNLRVFNRPLPNAMLRWSPDGSRLAFLAWVNDVPQVAVVTLGEAIEARLFTSAPGGVRAYAWAPDSRRLAYVAGDRESPADEQRRKDRAFFIRVDSPDRPVRAWVQDGAEAPPRVLTPPHHYVEALDWSPDGHTLAYSASSIAGFMAQYDTKLYTIAADGGEPRALVDRAGMNSGPRFSPDGRYVAFFSTAGRTELKAPRGLAIVEVFGDRSAQVRRTRREAPRQGRRPSRDARDARGGGAPRALRNAVAAQLSITELTRDTWVGEFVWAPDSRSLHFISTEGTFGRRAQMFEQPIGRVALDGKPPERVTDGRHANFSLTRSRDGRRLVYRSVGPIDTGDVFVLDAGQREPRRLTTINPQLADLDLVAPEPVSWKAPDGMEIWGLLFTPKQAGGGRRVPLVVYVHGGPIGGFTWGLFPQFAHRVGQVEPYPVQAFVSAGMAVLLPMPRGGSGYGEEGHKMIVNAWGDRDYADIMAGVDATIATGLADPDRLGVMGASYGGFMTSWIVTQTSRFKAASTGASVNDLLDMYFLSDSGEVMVEYFGSPWDPEARAGYVAHSPITHVARVTTPLLIQHGELDQRVPIAQVWKFYRALKAHKKIVEFDIYPRAGHVVYEPDLQREQMLRNIEWFTRWLK